MAESSLFADLAGAEEDFIVTRNQMGFMTVAPDPFSQALIDFAPYAPGPMLEIGAAYGVAAIRALEKGVQVIANDLAPEHLEILRQKTPEHLRSNLTLKPGRFPTEIDFPDASLGCVLSCRVIHFLDGDEIRAALSMLYRWLKPGGKICIVVETPYVKPFQPIIPQYEARVRNNEEWPGCFDNIHEIYAVHAPELVNRVPNLLHYLNETVLSRELSRAGFVVERCHTLNRIDFPVWLRLDGRESVGIIGRKE